MKVRGYIFSRAFMGERVPQHIQNQIIRKFCEINNLESRISKEVSSAFRFADSSKFPSKKILFEDLI